MEHETGRQVLSAEYDRREKRMEGYYSDRKGISNQIVFLSTPLPATDRPKAGETPKSAAPQAAPKAVKKEKTNEQKATPSKSGDTLEEEESPVSGLWQDTM